MSHKNVFGGTRTIGVHVEPAPGGIGVEWALVFFAKAASAD